MALKRIPVPTGVALDNDGRILVLTWPGGVETRHGAFPLRVSCPCAGCVEEMTGRRTLREETVDPEIAVVGHGRVGRYALQLRFSDGHGTGIFPYEALHAGTD